MLPLDEDFKIGDLCDVGRNSKEPGADGGIEGLDVTRVNLVPTKRAGRVAFEPLVDAIHVESMLTLGQQPKNLGVVELGQANGAF